jgi:hypothetical protein
MPASPRPPARRLQRRTIKWGRCAQHRRRRRMMLSTPDVGLALLRFPPLASVLSAALRLPRGLGNRQAIPVGVAFTRPSHTPPMISPCPAWWTSHHARERGDPTGNVHNAAVGSPRSIAVAVQMPCTGLMWSISEWVQRGGGCGVLLQPTPELERIMHSSALPGDSFGARCPKNKRRQSQSYGENDYAPIFASMVRRACRKSL